MSEVVLENVWKIYDQSSVAVENVNLTIRPREFMVLVGPSGCGKSTTLRMIAGLEEISRGAIRIGDRTVNHLPPKDRDIAMVFQNYALYPHKSVYENMAFGLKLRKFPPDEIRRRVLDAAAILGLEPYLDRKPKALSGGQRQRVAVGRAIVRNPAVFLFDEPLSNLDAKMRVQMRTEISRLHHRLQTTMIYVTHDQTEAMTMGDRLCVMKGGVIQQVATPLEIYERPANLFVAGFIGTPPTNFFDGTLSCRDGRLRFDAPSLSLPLPEAWSSDPALTAGRQVVLGIRPEHLGSELAASDGDAAQIRAEVELVEPMGSETFLHLRTADGVGFIARIGLHSGHRIGDTVVLKPDLLRAHLFDRTDEHRLI